MILPGARRGDAMKKNATKRDYKNRAERQERARQDPVQITINFRGGWCVYNEEAFGALRITESPLVPSMKAPVVRGSAGAFL
jgi:hypothetical protein